MRAGLVVLSLLLFGCSFGTISPPPRPSLPEVAYVAPCDTKAVVGLTSEAVEALRNRDLILRHHIELLEQRLQDTRSTPTTFPSLLRGVQ
jgi:hypothetical protein